MKDFRGTALITGVIGFFVVFGSAGSSDCGKPLTECLLWAAVGVLIMAVSFMYIYLYEKLVIDAE